MLYHDLKLALRHLWRRRMYTFIIVLSLTVGFTSANLLVSFLIAEKNTDSFHVNKDRTFQLFSDDPFNTNGKIAYIPNFVSEYLKDNYPEVNNICHVSGFNGIALQTGAGEFNDIALLSTDSSFFSVFSFPLYQGSSEKIFTPENIILSKHKATLLFGETDVVGKFLNLKTADTTRTLTVSGVFDEAPENSHLVFDAVIHHSVLENKGRGGTCYVLLNAGAQYSALETKVNADTLRPGMLEAGNTDYFLVLLKDSYFNKTNTLPYTRTRSEVILWAGYIVCGLILFMATFNFINLFLLSLQERRKEAGIKKVLGLSFLNIIKSSFIEVSLYISVAFGLALVLTFLILPSFNYILETDLPFEYLVRIQVLSTITAIIFTIGIIVIIISAVQQSKTPPVSLIKNNSTARLTFNRSLFTVQFVIAITLAICATTIIRQMNFIKNAPLGFNRNVIQLQTADNEMAAKLPVLKESILRISGINHASICSGNPISGNMMVRYDLENGTFYTPYLFNGDEDLIKTLNLTLLEGQLVQANTQGTIVNEKLVRFFNMQHPLGEIIPGTKSKIIGVVKDFTCGSFKQEVPPVIINYAPNARRMLIDYGGENFNDLLPQIQAAWDQIFPGHFFSYQIIQQDLMKKYKEETFFHKTVVAFAVLSLVISCFGLFALSWAVIQGRTKEIGIRKVLGATTKDILNLLTITFTKRILLAFIIATPVGYLLMNKWLEIFVNKIPLNVWVFILSGVVVTIIAFATLSYQTVRAALTNPVDELKNE